MTETLQAGPELDARVAEACGIDVIRTPEKPPLSRDGVYRVTGKFGGGPATNGTRFSPSTDMNDAMEAAKRIGLLTLQCESLIPEHESWEADIIPFDYDPDCPPEYRQYAVSAPTAQLAICAAILKVKA